ncbi:MAG: flagellar basal-body rod protein FlgC [Chthoniobacter sp.]|jgi:flagellar basal-body rod protein FlgC|nr:flagellar basal-body rod protein FlgC [Chthoniobacter sp.]
MNVLSGIDITASALNAEKMRMDVVAENVANAHTTHGPDGKPYQRKLVSFETVLRTAGGARHALAGGVRVAKVKNDPTPGPAVYDPQHPDADASGMVQMPNVNLAFEMVDLISSTRAYEANLAVVKNAKQMAHKALSIGH